MLKLDYVLEPNMTLIPANLIPETWKTVDPNVISGLEKQRELRREHEELCVGHIDNLLSDRIYDCYVSVKDPIELWSTLNLSKRQMRKVLTSTLCISTYSFKWMMINLSWSKCMNSK